MGNQELDQSPWSDQMIKRVLLVDYENIQKVELSNIPNDTKVYLVFGAKQKKLPTDLVLQGDKMKDRFTYVSINEMQHNAVDFCIAFYLGEYLARHPKVECIILSKDKKGFDPLVKHLKIDREFKVRRVDDQKEAFHPDISRAIKDNFLNAVEKLKGEKTLPKKRSGLEGKIKSYFPNASSNERSELVNRLFEEGMVSVSGAKLSFRLS